MQHLQGELASLRSGRASPGMLDHLKARWGAGVQACEEWEPGTAKRCARAAYAGADAATPAFLRLLPWRCVCHTQAHPTRCLAPQPPPHPTTHPQVDVYGDRLPLKACGSASVRDPQLLVVTVFDVDVSWAGAGLGWVALQLLGCWRWAAAAGLLLAAAAGLLLLGCAAGCRSCLPPCTACDAPCADLHSASTLSPLPLPPTPTLPSSAGGAGGAQGCGRLPAEAEPAGGGAGGAGARPAVSTGARAFGWGLGQPCPRWVPSSAPALAPTANTPWVPS